MTNDVMLGGLYLLMAMMLVLGALMTRREPWARTLTMLLAWIAIFGGGFVLFTFRDNLGYFAQRLRSEATGAPIQVGDTIRIPQSIDGHFYVEGSLNGTPVKFLIDSGATVTTVSLTTARRARLDIDPKRTQIVQTGNGVVSVALGRADSLTLGSIERRGMMVHVGAEEGLNVLGMNFLSSLQRWGVDGRWLVLES